MRTALLLSALLLTACQSRDGCFGRVRKPTARRLVVENSNEPNSLDPQFALLISEGAIAQALFSSLVHLNPESNEPIADIATHYERNPDATLYTFYLRGHPQPRGIRLANTDDLRQQYQSGAVSQDYARNRSAPPDSVPARWSDGSPVTAHDFVYSWRRLANPKTAAPYAPAMCGDILNADEILAGKRKPEELGVRALDDWTLEAVLAHPTDFFLQRAASWSLLAVPRQAIEQAEQRKEPASWTGPKNIVTSGPFRLAEWRPYERIVLQRNPGYWEASNVELDEIVLLPIADKLTNMNLYRSGEADTLDPPGDFIRSLSKLRDFQTVQAQDISVILCNTRHPPTDNVLVRYSLNMAIDKGQVAKMDNARQEPSRTYVLPGRDYTPPASVPVRVNGQSYDVRSYNPQAARQLLAAAGFPRGVHNGQPLRIEFAFINSDSRFAELLQRQLNENLGIELVLKPMEVQVLYGAEASGAYQALASSDFGASADPTSFLDMFLFPDGGGTFWNPAAFLRLLRETRATADRPMRMRKLAECDRMAMEGMAMIPLCDSWLVRMTKPYVHALPFNDRPTEFKYAWVETQ